VTEPYIVSKIICKPWFFLFRSRIISLKVYFAVSRKKDK